MPSQFRVGVIVPVADEVTGATITQRLQAATTQEHRIGAWVMRRREGERFTGEVLVDFTITADTLEEAKARALTWTRAELARGSDVEGVGEPADAGTIV